MEEIWKTIPGYEDYYEVSNLGRVRRIKTGYILKPSGKEYLEVCLSKHNKQRYFYIHRLVATAFLPNPENKPEVNHINGKKGDNRVENLEWFTRQENIQHAWKTGLSKGRKGDKCPMYGKHFSEEHRRKLGEAHKKENLSVETLQKMRQHMKGSIFVNNGCHLIKPEKLQEYLNNGCVKRHNNKIS